MKNVPISKIAIVAISLFAIATSNAFADTTRAQVKSELRQLEAVGYQPGSADPHYPDRLQAAEQKVATENQAEAQAPAVSSEGSNGGTVSASGTGSHNACIGPVSFCTPFFGGN
jgi:hypothetical protein